MVSFRSERHEFFVKAVLLFSTTIFPLVVGKLWVPLDAYAFRCWEGLRDENPVCGQRGSFYPDQVCQKTEVGEIGLRSRYEVKKRVRWVTDAAGFRNEPAVANGPIAIVIVGDSSVAGAALSQEETLPVVLSGRLGKGVYSYAPERMATFLGDPRFIEKPPDAVIFVGVVSHLHNILEPLRLSQLRVNSQNALAEKWACRHIPESWRIYCEQVKKKPWLNQHLYKVLAKQTSPLLIANEATGMVFYRASLDQMREYAVNPQGYLRHAKNTLMEYRDALAQRGITFLFVPVPDKEIVYWEEIPAPNTSGLKRPVFASLLADALREAGITVVDPESTLRAVRKTQGVPLYHLDDTHWNVNAVVLVSDLIADALTPLQQGQTGTAHAF